MLSKLNQTHDSSNIS